LARSLRATRFVHDLPAATEAGYPELTVEAPVGLFGPKGMPRDLRARIADVRAIAIGQTIMKRLEAAGMLAKASTPEEYAATLAGFARRDLRRASTVTASTGTPHRRAPGRKPSGATKVVMLGTGTAGPDPDRAGNGRHRR
jgi:tripartite-type tricarboxylate transporter receptor subunit TctC